MSYVLFMGFLHGIQITNQIAMIHAQQPLANQKATIIQINTDYTIQLQ